METMQNLPKIMVFNSKVQPGDLTKGVKEMKRLLAEAEQPKYAYQPKIIQDGEGTNKKRSTQRRTKRIL